MSKEDVQLSQAPETQADAVAVAIGRLGVWLVAFSGVTPLVDGNLVSAPRPLHFTRLSHEAARQLHTALGRTLEEYDRERELGRQEMC
jgi:hypothetical protein